VRVRGFGRVVGQLRAQWGVASLPKQQQQQHPPTVHKKKKKKKKKKLRGRESVLPFVEKKKKKISFGVFMTLSLAEEKQNKKIRKKREK
jgi:hypothetical protein